MKRIPWKPVTNRRAGTSKIPLQGGRGGYAVIDLRDLKKVAPYTWYRAEIVRPTGETYAYVRATIWDGAKKMSLQLGRLILNAGNRDRVLYKNQDRFDNRRCNLRLGSKSEAEHTKGARAGTSSYKGVHWCRNNQRWIGLITLERNVKRKRFTDEDAAAHWVDEMARKHYAHGAPMNFPRHGEVSARADDS